MGDLNPFDSSRGIGKSIKKTIKDPTRLITKPVETLITDPIKQGIEVTGGLIKSEVPQITRPLGEIASSDAGKSLLSGGVSYLTGNPAPFLGNLNSQANEFEKRKTPTPQPTRAPASAPYQPVITSGGGMDTQTLLLIGGAIVAVFLIMDRRK